MWKIIWFLKQNNTLLLIGALLVLVACNSKTYEPVIPQRPMVAVVGTDTLYKSDVQKMLKSVSGQDSLRLRERFVTSWIRKALLLQVAQNNLTDTELDIENMVREYRASLLINQYKQKYLAEHLNTVVTEKEIGEYVTKHASNFITKETLYHFYSAKILTKNKKDIKFIKKLFSEKEINLMQDFDLENTTVISNCDEDWYTEKELLKYVPLSPYELKVVLKKDVVITKKEEDITYILKPLAIVKKGQMSPQEIINEKVTKIILHNRKIALAQQLEYEIYEDAKNKNQFEVY